MHSANSGSWLAFFLFFTKDRQQSGSTPRLNSWQMPKLDSLGLGKILLFGLKAFVFYFLVSVEFFRCDERGEP